jgi:hypothetical protein
MFKYCLDELVDFKYSYSILFRNKVKMIHTFYLFDYPRFFNDAFNSSDYIASNE